MDTSVQKEKNRGRIENLAAGIPVVWTIIVEDGSLNGCNNEMVLPPFDQQIRLTEGENTITFTPEEAGSYPYSCWMGMLRNTITVTELPF